MKVIMYFIINVDINIFIACSSGNISANANPYVIIKVSTICDTSVDKVFLNQSHFIFEL